MHLHLALIVRAVLLPLSLSLPSCAFSTDTTSSILSSHIRSRQPVPLPWTLVQVSAVALFAPPAVSFCEISESSVWTSYRAARARRLSLCQVLQTVSRSHFGRTSNNRTIEVAFQLWKPPSKDTNLRLSFRVLTERKLSSASRDTRGLLMRLYASAGAGSKKLITTQRKDEANRKSGTNRTCQSSWRSADGSAQWVIWKGSTVARWLSARDWQAEANSHGGSNAKDTTRRRLEGACLRVDETNVTNPCFELNHLHVRSRLRQRGHFQTK